MALLSRTHQIAPDMHFSTSGTPVCSVVCASDTPPGSGSRLGSQLARLRECLKGAFVKSPAVFEIHNMRTGERAVRLGTFTDGTLADRAARDLGHDWRVFRQETGPNQNLRSSCEAASDTNEPVESSLPPTQVPPRRQSQHPFPFYGRESFLRYRQLTEQLRPQHPIPFNGRESGTSESLEALHQGLQHSQPVAPALPSETYAPSAHGKSLFQSSRLSEHIRFDHGQVTIEFGNPVELEERLVLLSYLIANEPEVAEPHSTGIVPEVLVELEHR